MKRSEIKTFSALVKIFDCFQFWENIVAILNKKYTQNIENAYLIF